MVAKEDRFGGEGMDGAWVWHMHSEVYGMTGQWGPAVEHREHPPANILWSSMWEKNLKEKGCVYVCVSHFAVQQNDHNFVNQLDFNKILKKI